MAGRHERTHVIFEEAAWSDYLSEMSTAIDNGCQKSQWPDMKGLSTVSTVLHGVTSRRHFGH